MTEEIRRIGPFDVCDGIYEHMGDEYRGGVWLYTAPVDAQQALERAEFFKRACHEAQDIAAAAQEELESIKQLMIKDLQTRLPKPKGDK